MGLWYQRKLRDTREANNGGKVKVRIIHGLNISQKNSYTYCKNLEVIKNQHYAHAPRGIDWQEKTIACPRPPLIRKAIKEHPMLQICHTTFTIRACYGTSKPQHKYFSIPQLLNQHDSNITIFISQNNYQVSNFSQYLMHSI